MEKYKDHQRLDLKFIKNLNVEDSSDSSSDTFKHLESDDNKSLYSSPRAKFNKEYL